MRIAYDMLNSNNEDQAVTEMIENPHRIDELMKHLSEVKKHFWDIARELDAFGHMGPKMRRWL
jgi:hypothetical protein